MRWRAQAAATNTNTKPHHTHTHSKLTDNLELNAHAAATELFSISSIYFVCLGAARRIRVHQQNFAWLKRARTPKNMASMAGKWDCWTLSEIGWFSFGVATIIQFTHHSSLITIRESYETRANFYNCARTNTEKPQNDCIFWAKT